MQILMSGAVPGEEGELGHFGVRGVLAVLDTESGDVVKVFEYEPPDELKGGQHIQFTGFCFDADRLYVCSFNEVVVLGGWPRPQVVGRITLPGFNDLHHCLRWRDGLAIANTGLETVDYVSLDGQLKERWDMLAGDEGAREIDDTFDYRMLPDTKPHRRHANHVFSIDGELWATQLRISAATQVTGGSGRIEMGVGMPHDGMALGADRVFTTTNGHLVLVDPRSGALRRQVKLVELTPNLEQLGWCRGVARHPEKPELFFVSFSKGRRSKWMEVAYRIRRGHFNPPGRIALYDLAGGGLRETWPIGEDPGLILFQLEVLPPSRAL